ncbi:MAG: hypothetical protein AAF790_15130 [Planctomycetota bacterium]
MVNTKRRTKAFVDREVQGALAWRLARQWVLFVFAAAAMVLALQWMSNPFAPIRENLVEAWWTHAPVLLVLVCLAPVFAFDAIKLSNRFTGPIHRLRLATRALADGQAPGHVEFRGADFWQDLASDFNRVAEKVAAGNAEPAATGSGAAPAAGKATDA